ncbi:hypothetical protein BURKHO8Y_540005 [Burkholderia sp. 8Y]|nr:hypothetical protein BURKHO8Y_540005 [Burkholderia sp. 8Y]
MGSEEKPASGTRRGSPNHSPEFRRRLAEAACEPGVSDDGLWLLAKRLSHGRFIWPQADGGKVYLTSAQLSMLLEGIDWRQPRRRKLPFRLDTARGSRSVLKTSHASPIDLRSPLYSHQRNALALCS